MELTKTDTALSEEVATEYEGDLQAVFSALQEEVLQIVDSGAPPEEIISKIENLLR